MPGEPGVVSKVPTDISITGSVVLAGFPNFTCSFEWATTPAPVKMTVDVIAVVVWDMFAVFPTVPIIPFGARIALMEGSRLALQVPLAGACAVVPEDDTAREVTRA